MAITPFEVDAVPNRDLVAQLFAISGGLVIETINLTQTNRIGTYSGVITAAVGGHYRIYVYIDGGVTPLVVRDCPGLQDITTKQYFLDLAYANVIGIDELVDASEAAQIAAEAAQTTSVTTHTAAEAAQAAAEIAQAAAEAAQAAAEATQVIAEATKNALYNVEIRKETVILGPCQQQVVRMPQVLPRSLLERVSIQSR